VISRWNNVKDDNRMNSRLFGAVALLFSLNIYAANNSDTCELYPLIVPETTVSGASVGARLSGVAMSRDLKDSHFCCEYASR
jgi:hypothetical protein